MERGREGRNESGGREERGRRYRAYDNSRTQDNIRSKLANVRLKSPVSSQMLMHKPWGQEGERREGGREGGRGGRDGMRAEGERREGGQEGERR